MGRTQEFFKKYRRVLVVMGRIGSVLLSLLLVVFCNMFKSFNADNFNFKGEFIKNLNDPLTWILAVSVAVAWTVVYVVVYSFSKEKKIEDNKATFIKFHTLNKSRPNNMRDFIKKVINPRRKRLAYYDKMENKLMKVQTEIEKIPMEKLESDKYKKLKAQESDIIAHSSSEYVEKHLLHLNAKYNVVKLEHFTFAISDIKTTDQTDSKEKKKLGKKLAAKILLGTLGSMCGVSIFTTLEGMFEWNDSSLWITLIMILITIFMQVYFATDDANVLVDSEIIAPTLNKIEILEEAMLWEEADMKNKPFEKMVDDYIEQENKELQKKKSATISRAELEYLQNHKEEINNLMLKEQEMKGEQNDGDNK